ncbi:MAG: Cdc6/Cdc18 family protein [Candidatus Hodarchaeales archaeon]
MGSHKPVDFNSLFSTHNSVFKEDGEKIFSNYYIPDQLWHREEEMSSLVNYFRSIITEPTASSRKVVIYGPVGTGKTVISRKFGMELTRFMNYQSGLENIYFKYFHVNCRKTKTPHLILTTILRKLVPGFPMRGFSVGELIGWLNLILHEQNLVTLLILDEIDYLIPEERTDFLYSLSRLEEASSTELKYTRLNEKHEARLNLIAVTRDMNFRHYLDPSTASSLGRNIIIFNPYTRAQIFDIVSSRAEKGLQDNTYDDDLIELIASLAEEYGDARFAIELLWRAAKFADQNGSNRILPEHVRKMMSSVLPIDKSILDDLSLHQKLIMLSIAKMLHNSDKAYITTPELKEYYKQVCEEANVRPRRQTRFWTYLKDLDRLGLIQQEVSNRHKEGRALGRVALIKIRDIPVEEIIQNLNPLIGSIQDSDY